MNKPEIAQADKANLSASKTAQAEATWSGWACQYPGKLPRLYGAREIAEVNLDEENGDRLLFLTTATTGVPNGQLQHQSHSPRPAMSFEEWHAKHGPNGGAYDIEMQRAGWGGAIWAMSAAPTGAPLTDERMDEIMRVAQSIANRYAFVGDAAFPRGREKLREVLAPAITPESATEVKGQPAEAINVGGQLPAEGHYWMSWMGGPWTMTQSPLWKGYACADDTRWVGPLRTPEAPPQSADDQTHE
jgi:hypothetical protein